MYMYSTYYLFRVDMAKYFMSRLIYFQEPEPEGSENEA